MDKIKYLVMDVDGTLTDGKLYLSDSGEVMKAFNIKDGLGIKELLIPAGITPIIITGRKSGIVQYRCNELGIKEVYQGVGNKLKKLKTIVSDLSKIAYIGDDLNDLDCIKNITESGGIVGCPSDAVETIRTMSNYICSQKGGEGCVREFIEWILDTRQ